MATRSEFLAAYRKTLQNYPWARDPEKLDRFMVGVETTLKGERADWQHRGHAVNQAWRQIGYTGQPTLKALRALPT